MTIIQTAKPLEKRRAYDFYPTPGAVVERALNLIEIRDFYALAGAHKETPYILDPGCGTGVWGQAALARWRDAVVDGVEVRDIPTPQGYRYLYRGDFCLNDHGLDYDLVIGNPPFVYAEMFVKNALANLKDDGMLLYLLPLRFLEGKARAKGLFRHHPPLEVHVAGRVSFSGNKKTDDTVYAFYIWKKGWHGTPSLKWAL